MKLFWFFLISALFVWLTVFLYKKSQKETASPNKKEKKADQLIIYDPSKKDDRLLKRTAKNDLYPFDLLIVKPISQNPKPVRQEKISILRMAVTVCLSIGIGAFSGIFLFRLWELLSSWTV